MLAVLRLRGKALGVLAPVCSSFGFLCVSQSRRCFEMPKGDLNVHWVASSNMMAARTLAASRNTLSFGLLCADTYSKVSICVFIHVSTSTIYIYTYCFVVVYVYTYMPYAYMYVFICIHEHGCGVYMYAHMCGTCIPGDLYVVHPWVGYCNPC